MITIAPVTSVNLPAFSALLRAIAAEENLDGASSAARAAEGVRASLAQYDFTRSDTTWMLLATVGDTPAGYASLVRIPKADARIGFLFVDELYVLNDFRRRGVARQLLAHAVAHGRALDLAGVRLLVRTENVAARHLYRAAGFREHETIFCEQTFERSNV